MGGEHLMTEQQGDAISFTESQKTHRGKTERADGPGTGEPVPEWQV